MTKVNRSPSTSQHRFASLAALAVAAVVGLCATPQARASLTLNAAGVAAGFSLSTFYSDPSVTYGLLSLANGSDGNLYAAGYGYGLLMKFADVDGQTFGTRLASVSAGGTVTGMASVGGAVYAGFLGGDIYRIDAALGKTAIGLTGLTFDYGLWANPVTGHLIASTSRGLVDVNPLTGTWVQIGPVGVFVDGVSVSNDGTVAYGAFTGDGSIRGYSLASPNPAVPVFSSVVGHGLDGTGVISGGIYDGDLIVDNNDGTLGLIDIVTGLETIIADSGSRGDLVSADRSNGTLLLTQYEGVLRLSCGPGCTIGSNPTPEPATILIAGLGLAAMAVTRRRRRA